MLRVGIVGTGEMAANRLQSFAKLQSVKVAGVCSRSIEKAAGLCEPFEAQPYTSYAQMLADTDATVICTTNELHFSQALQALESGNHVLVEYPLCIGMDQVEELRGAAEKMGKVLMVGNTIIHEKLFAYLREHLDQLGGLVSASARVSFHSESLRDVWYLDPLKTGPMFAAIQYHFIEYFKRLFGSVEWVVATNESIPNPNHPGILKMVGGTVLLRHASGATSTIQMYLSISGEGTARGFWLNGKDGTVTVISLTTGKARAIWNGDESTAEEYDDDWGVDGSTSDFIEAIDGRFDHRTRLSEDIETMKIGILAWESAQTGQVVYNK